MTKADATKRMYECMRLQRKSPRTVEVYLMWLEKYISFLSTCTADTQEAKLGQFLTRIVTQDKVSASTQKQALCALVYFYKRVLRVEIGDISFLYSRRQKRIPVVFSRSEAWRVLDRLDGDGWLWGALMYGCGLRLEEVCNLRVKDLDIDRHMVIVREGKGSKDRAIPMPELLVEPLEKHLRLAREKWERFSGNRVPVSLPGRLDKKYPQAPYSWEWFWVFPASGPARDPKWEGKLYHVHKTAVQKRVRRAIRAAGIVKKASCHTFRHSFATHWLEGSEGSHEVALKRLQELMGHKDVRTTMEYLHLLPKKTDVPSPLDVREVVGV
jgi:integron integrase